MYRYFKQISGIGSGETGRNIIIFGVDISSSTKIDHRKKDILVLGKCPTQRLEHTLSAEKLILQRIIKSCVWACIKMEQIVIHLSMAQKFINSSQKNSDIVATPLCLGKISNDWSVDSMKKTWLNGFAYDFSVDYNDTAVEDILDIHNYLMKKYWDNRKGLDLLKTGFWQQCCFLVVIYQMWTH